ncbi:unnamed protein product [Clonostachys rhizophaga]|uniref:Uncharacterized protein n=1 Tax=Clonostachys rhizophaga TaxID=160324 RepID=A0A9N9W4D9_9HYPO|nr:unnamed protein product [Clonostachys rhizophaga]
MPPMPPATRQPKTGNSVPQIRQLLSNLNYDPQVPERELLKDSVRRFSRDFVTKDGTRCQALNQWSSSVHQSGLEEMAASFLSEFGSRFWPCDPTMSNHNPALVWPLHEQKLTEILKQLFYRKNAHLIKNTKRKTRLMGVSGLWNASTGEESSPHVIEESVCIGRQRRNILGGNVSIKAEMGNYDPEEHSEEHSEADLITERVSHPPILGTEDAQTGPNHFSSLQHPEEMETHNEERETYCSSSESIISADLVGNDYYQAPSASLMSEPEPSRHSPTPEQPPSRPDVIFRLIESRAPFYEGSQWYPKGNFSDKTLSQLKEELPLPFVSEAKYFGFTLTGPQFLMSTPKGGLIIQKDVF